MSARAPAHLTPNQEEQAMQHKKLSLGVFVTMAFTLSIAALAAKPEEAIKYRRGVMAAQGWNFRAMGEAVKGEQAYDKAEFAQRAAHLAALSKMTLEGFLADGSDKGDTKAKPETFTEIDKVKANLERLQLETSKLAQVAAGGELGAIKAQYGEVAKICKGCHDSYRNR
jgi:cytochrome c556